MNTSTRRPALPLRTSLFLAACLVSATWAGAQPAALAAGPKPNIVVFYIDDAAPHDGRLWNDPQRTPAIHDTFIAHGIHFTNAFGEDPLCCPARGNILTGLHTHNNGVDLNDARLFSPQETVAGELRDAGYSTMWIGKYMNMNNRLSSDGWTAHMAPWSVFDGMYGFNGDYYGYRVRTKDHGDISYADVHSTQMVADRSVNRFSAAPPDKPIFAILSLYNLHGPNDPVPITPQQSAMCDGINPWWTPAYNEADVSDKPAHIRALPRLRYADGWPMVAYCREMFGIDMLVKRVTDELEAEGRLDNTLLVFTADNGMTWGAHRKPQQKNVPYATPVPLYMAWPTGWGTTPREIDDYVTNIDLAPTFCELGGCTLGPYPTGQDEPDGRSLVALIDQGEPLGRDALLESSPLGDASKGIPGWAAVRTTPQSALGLWHYVEYASGERELYDQVSDPYELNNLAGDPGHTSVQVALAQRLAQLLAEGRVNRPDLSIWARGLNIYAGYNLFDSVPTPRQTLTLKGLSVTTYVFRVQMRNHKVSSDSFNVTSTVGGADLVVVRWLLAGSDVTAQMKSGGLHFNSLAGSGIRNLTLQVRVKRRYSVNARTIIEIDVHSLTNSTQDDHVTLILKR